MKCYSPIVNIYKIHLSIELMKLINTFSDSMPVVNYLMDLGIML